MFNLLLLTNCTDTIPYVEMIRTQQDHYRQNDDDDDDDEDDEDDEDDKDDEDDEDDKDEDVTQHKIELTVLGYVVVKVLTFCLLVDRFMI